MPVVATKYGGRPAPVPQSYFDYVAVDAATCCGAAMSMGPFTHTATRDGLWSDPLTWDAGTAPGANAVVDVGSRTVTYDAESDVQIKDIHVGGRGTLRWATHKDTRLWVDTIMCHGVFIMGEAGDPITESATCGKPRAEIIFWQSQAPGTTTRLGLNCMGPVRRLGADKTSRLFGATDLLAGRDTFRLPGLSRANWRPGDKILFVATEWAGTAPTDPQYTGPTQFLGPFEGGDDSVLTRALGYMQSRDEVRTVVSVTGDTLKIDAPLTYDHLVQTTTLPHGQAVRDLPPVCLLSRSIRIRSEDPSAVQKRGHTMDMFHDDVDCRGVEFKDLGRTDTNPALVRPEGTLAYASDGGAVITDPNNVRGRYPVHLHWTGAFAGRRQAVVADCSVWGEDHPIPGWAMTQHASRAALERNVIYNVRGAGMVSELGNETGQWIDNTVAWCRGDGFDVSWGSRAEYWTNHNGSAGVAYENQARNVLQQGNIAASSHFGWLFLQQLSTMLARVPDIDALRLVDPLTQGAGLFGGVTAESRPYYGVEQAQIPDFDDNRAYACGNGFGVAHRQFTDRTDTTPMLSRRFRCWNTRTAFNLINYTFNYSFHDFVWSGTGTGSGARLGNVSWAINLVNGVVRNHATGLVNSGIGHNFNGAFVDVAFEGCAVTATDFAVDWDITAWQAANPGKTFPQDHAMFNLMDAWQTEVSTPTRWKGVLRRGAPYTSAQLPVPYPSAPRGMGGAEPLPGTAKPYFWLDPAGDTAITPTGSVDFYGVIVDGIGVRCWPEFMSSESFGPETAHLTRPHRQNEAATGTELVQRNGCFNDNGVWKTRLWFADQERLSGQYFQFAVDLTLSGFDAGFLAANTVIPAPPELPLRREEIGPPRPYIPDTTPPVVTSAAAVAVPENEPLAHRLKANSELGTWAITGGADAARFEIITASGITTLRWAGNTTRDFESPQDANSDNAYQVTVTFTLPNGLSGSQAVTVTVRDKNEAVTTPFTDNFNRADEPLEASPNWFLLSGAAGRAGVKSNGLQTLTTGTRAAYASPNTGSPNHYVEMSVNNAGGVHLAASLSDGDNYIGAYRSGSNVVLATRVAGTDTVLGTWAGAANATIRLEYAGGVATVKRNGVTLGAVTVSTPPPATTRCGVVAVTGTATALADNYAAGAL